MIPRSWPWAAKMTLWQRWKLMINRECLDWDPRNWTEALIFRSNFSDVCIIIPGKEKAVSSWWKPFSEVVSHRNSLGSNEKKMLNSPTLLLKNIASSVFKQWFYQSWRKCLHRAVSTMSAFSEHLGNSFYIVVLKISPQEADLMGNSLPYDQTNQE